MIINYYDKTIIAHTDMSFLFLISSGGPDWIIAQSEGEE